MLCTFCNTARLDNEAPCSYCGAPSPLAGKMKNTFGGQLQDSQQPESSPFSWGGPVSPIPNISQQLSLQSQPQGFFSEQAPFSQAQSQDFAQVQPDFSQPQHQSFSTQTFAQAASQAFQQASQPQALPQGQPLQSRLPIPYQPPQPQQQMGLLPTGLNPYMPTGALIPVHETVTSLIPAISPQEEEAVYIEPMYTKPRPIIPRYRAISGLLSLLIVFTLLCTGAGYYAKASGTFSFLRPLYEGLPEPITSHDPTLPDPKTTEDFGPAYASGIISSAVIGSRIDPTTRTVTVPERIFKPGDTIYLNYSVYPNKPGRVTVKWYTNKILFRDTPPQLITESGTASTSMQFTQSTEGMLELYWNDQFAIRIYFVVR